jgi:SAM-dependent methyltransferase
MDISDVNRIAWDKKVAAGNPFTQPVSAELVAIARQGQWQICLTDTKPVPRQWFPDLLGCEVLCLGGGGGQQGPLLAAVGARVTVFDISPKQLGQDRFVAEREKLELQTIQGDMSDLSALADQSFDLIVNPVSSLFVPDVYCVWREAYRVLRPQGILLAGFMNPMEYIFDLYRLDQEGVLEVKHPLPFSSLTSLTDAERERYFGADAQLEFSHTLEAQIGGQMQVGFVLTDFYEDRRADDLLGQYIPSSFATRAIKPLYKQ